jgi:hypothetical protein
VLYAFERHLHLFHSPGGVAESGPNVISLEIGISPQDLILGVTGSQKAQDGSDRDSHPANAGLASHDLRVEGVSLECAHGFLLPET